MKRSDDVGLSLNWGCNRNIRTHSYQSPQNILCQLPKLLFTRINLQVYVPFATENIILQVKHPSLCKQLYDSPFLFKTATQVYKLLRISLRIALLRCSKLKLTDKFRFSGFSFCRKHLQTSFRIQNNANNSSALVHMK